MKGRVSEGAEREQTCACSRDEAGDRLWGVSCCFLPKRSRFLIFGEARKALEGLSWVTPGDIPAARAGLGVVSSGPRSMAAPLHLAEEQPVAQMKEVICTITVSSSLEQNMG